MATSSNDKDICKNSLGVRGKVVSKREEVRKSAPLTDNNAQEFLAIVKKYSVEDLKDKKMEKLKAKEMDAFFAKFSEADREEVRRQVEVMSKIPAQLQHCKKIRKVVPTKQPVITEVDYNRSSGVKMVTYEKEKHVYNDSNEKGKIKKYKETSITQEQYPETITEHERNCLTKEDLIAKINKEVDNLNPEDFRSKEDILKFANGPGYISNTEKKRRAVALMKKINQFLQDNHKKELDEWKVVRNQRTDAGQMPEFERIRITSSEIASLRNCQSLS